MGFFKTPEEKEKEKQEAKVKFINKVKEKYNLTNVREDELKILSNIQSELS